MAQSETERFTGFAGRYDAGRPGYPPEVVERVLHGLGDPALLEIADLGAGTGCPLDSLPNGARWFLRSSRTPRCVPKAQRSRGSLGATEPPSIPVLPLGAS